MLKVSHTNGPSILVAGLTTIILAIKDLTITNILNSTTLIYNVPALHFSLCVFHLFETKIKVSG